MNPRRGVMFRCGKALIALALLMADPIAISAQTADNPPDPNSTPQQATKSVPDAELLKPEQLEALRSIPMNCWQMYWRHQPIRWRSCRPIASSRNAKP